MGILWDLRKKAIEHQKGRKVQEAIELQQQRPPLVSVTPIEGSVVDEKCAFLDEMAYRMNYPCRGYALIINNKHFEPCTRLGIREGTDADAERLRNCLRTFGFKVLLHKDLRLESMVSVIDEMSNADHSNCDMFLCAILSHGDESCIYGTDESMCIDNVYCSFKYTRSLYGKPKMFIFQACRGSKCMDSISISYDATPVRYVPRIPIEADFIFLFSTLPGYYSWRNVNSGSWFIQSFCHILEEFGTTLEIMQIFTRVNRRVAYYFESNSADIALSAKRQIPCIVSMLTKELYLSYKKRR